MNYWVPSFDGNRLAMDAFRWMKANVAIMQYYELFAMCALKKKKKFGISLLTERIRWEIRIVRQDTLDFKIDNDYRAYIARYLIYKYPDLSKYLRVKKLACERDI